MLSRLPEYRDYLECGRAYLGAAIAGRAKRPAVFTPAVVHDLALMAMEKLFMAVLLQRGVMPRGHTLDELLAAVGRVSEPPAALVTEVNWLTSLQQICDPHHWQRRDPTSAELDRLLAAAESAQRFVLSALPMVETG